MSLRPADLSWTEDGPVARDFGDVYFSRAGGLAETRHVFLGGNQLEQRFAQPDLRQFVIAETGFGTGLNFLAALDLWGKRPANSRGWLHYVAVEKHPLTLPDLHRALAMWPELAAAGDALLQAYPPLLPGFHQLTFPALNASLLLLFGEAAELLAQLQARVDAWFLDGFAPARNPTMWDEVVVAQIARLSTPKATLSTFTAAGSVRRALAAAGFSMRKIPGHGKKREMLVGEFTGKPAPESRPWLARNASPGVTQATVIGAGIAGASVARVLAERGFTVEVLEADTIACGGSGNPAAMVYPRNGVFQEQAFLSARACYRRISPAHWHECGVLMLAEGNQQRALTAAMNHPWMGSELVLLTPSEASTLTGQAIATPAIHYPGAGWLEPEAMCRALLQHPGIQVWENCGVHALIHDAGSWHLTTSQGTQICTGVLILANAQAAQLLMPHDVLNLPVVRGQIALAFSTERSSKLRQIICHGGYISPANRGKHCLGATFTPNDSDTTPRDADTQAIALQLQQALPAFAESLPPPAEWQARASLRCQPTDYLPLVGGLPQQAAFLTDYAGLRQGNTRNLPQPRFWPNLYLNVGHGSHGFSQAMLCADILAADTTGAPAPVPRSILESLHPARFWVRELRRNMKK